MKVEDAIRAALSEGQELRTPGRNKPFWVGGVDHAGLILLLGAKRTPTRLSWECLEGVVPFMRARGGEVPIGGRHEVAGNPGTLDEWLKGCVKRTTAGWVGVVLMEAGVVEITPSEPQHVRLTDEWR